MQTVKYEGLSNILNFQDCLQRESDGKIGGGGFGEVFKSQVINDPNMIVAQKVMKDKETMHIMFYSFFREVYISNNLRHPCFIRLVTYHFADYVKEKDGNPANLIVLPFSATEYSNNGDLSHYIKWGLKASESGHISRRQDTDQRVLDKALIIMYGIARGIQFMHSLNIIHRDIKPENILLDDNFYPKISDFGLAKEITEVKEGKQSIVGTNSYLAPEIKRNQPYSFPADIFSLARLFRAIFEGQPPIQERWINKSFWHKDFWKMNNTPYSIQNLIDKMREMTPAKRLTIFEVSHEIEEIAREEQYDSIRAEFEQYKSEIDQFEKDYLPRIRNILTKNTEEVDAKLFLYEYVSNNVYEEPKEKLKKLYRIQSLANSGNPLCLYAMGLVYLYGQCGIPCDLVMAYKYFLQAALNIQEEAKILLTMIKNECEELLLRNKGEGLYYQGMIEEAKEEYEKAVECYINSSKYDIPEAMGRLGILLIEHFNQAESGETLINKAIQHPKLDKNVKSLLYYHKVLFKCSKGEWNEALDLCNELHSIGNILAVPIIKYIKFQIACNKIASNHH